MPLHWIALFTFPFFESFLCLNLRLCQYNFCHLVGFFTLDIWIFWGVVITLTIDWTLWHFKATKAAQISIEPHNCLIRKRWSFKIIKYIFVRQQISQEIWIIFGLTGNTYTFKTANIPQNGDIYFCETGNISGIIGYSRGDLSQ